jgi:hypothetical protein
MSAARSTGCKRNAVRSATKRVVRMTDHDRLTVFFNTCSLLIGLCSKVLCLHIILSFLQPLFPLHMSQEEDAECRIINFRSTNWMKPRRVPPFVPLKCDDMSRCSERSDLAVNCNISALSLSYVDTVLSIWEQKSVNWNRHSTNRRSDNSHHTNFVEVSSATFVRGRHINVFSSNNKYPFSVKV